MIEDDREKPMVKADNRYLEVEVSCGHTPCDTPPLPIRRAMRHMLTFSARASRVVDVDDLSQQFVCLAFAFVPTKNL